MSIVGRILYQSLRRVSPEALLRDTVKNGGGPRLSSVIPLPNVAGLVAVFLRPLTNGITLASVVFWFSWCWQAC